MDKPTTHAFAAMLAIVFGLPATAAGNQQVINTDGRSELSRRLLRDASTIGPPHTVSNSKRHIAIRRMFRGGVAGHAALQNRDLPNLMAGAGYGPVTSPLSSKYRVTDIGTLGGSQSFAYAINDSGQIVGYSRIAGDSTSHSFLYDQGKMTDLYPLNSQDTVTTGPTGINILGQIASGIVSNNVYLPAIFDSTTNAVTMPGTLGGTTSNGFNGVATAINNWGQAVGYSYLNDINRHAFLHSNGVMKDIGSFGGYSGATAINDQGTIVGFASDRDNGRAHAFFYEIPKGVMIDIDPSGDSDFTGAESYARDINNSGQVVGEFIAKGQSVTRGFIYDNGTFTEIGAPASPYTAVLGINDAAQVVGTIDIPYVAVCPDPVLGDVPCIKFKPHAFVYADGQLTDLNRLIAQRSGWELAYAFDVNNSGQIVGYGLKNGNFRAFVLTPR